jgi:hypothetical protein
MSISLTYNGHESLKCDVGLIESREMLKMTDRLNTMVEEKEGSVLGRF